MNVPYLITQRDQLIEQLERQQYEFWPTNIVQVLELARIMETLEQLTTESLNLEDSCDVNGYRSCGRGAENECSE